MLHMLGILLLVAALAALVFYLRTSYVTQGGGLGQVPCVAAATIQVPLLTMLGLALLNDAPGGYALVWWQWLAIWLVETVFIAMAASWICDRGCRSAKRKAE